MLATGDSACKLQPLDTWPNRALDRTREENSQEGKRSQLVPLDAHLVVIVRFVDVGASTPAD